MYIVYVFTLLHQQLAFSSPIVYISTDADVRYALQFPILTRRAHSEVDTTPAMQQLAARQRHSHLRLLFLFLFPLFLHII